MSISHYLNAFFFAYHLTNRSSLRHFVLLILFLNMIARVCLSMLCALQPFSLCDQVTNSTTLNNFIFLFSFAIHFRNATWRASYEIVLGPVELSFFVCPKQ